MLESRKGCRKLEGTMPAMKSLTEGAVPWGAATDVAIVRPSEKGRPVYRARRQTPADRAQATASMRRNRAMSLAPNFPTSDRLLNWETLITREKNTMGETTILSELMNIVRPRSSTESFRAI